MEDFAYWLSMTEFSYVIQSDTRIIPWLQIIHITALALVFGSVLMVCGKLMNWFAAGESVDSILRRYLPWIWGGTVVLAVSGGLLVIGEPVRSLINEFFWAKMVVLAIALTGMGVLGARNRVDREYWEGAASRQFVMSLAIGSFAAWTLVIVFGRFIAYRDNFLAF